MFSGLNGADVVADGAPSSRNGIVPWSSAAVPLTVLSSHVLMCVSSSSERGVDAWSAHDHPSRKKPRKHLTHGQSMQTGSLSVVRASHERVWAFGLGR